MSQDPMSDHTTPDRSYETPDDAPDETRRRLVRTMLVAPIALAVPAVLGTAAFRSGDASAALLMPTPPCGDDDDDEPTPRQTEGPYFTPNSPKRASLLEPGVTGTRLVVTGMVLTRSCRPVANALVDFWQCDDAGDYDNSGYRLRGHQFTDARGVYRLETIVPGVYPGRTRHIHVKVQAPQQRVLTTQLYFPDERRNDRDRIFDPELLMRMTGAAGARRGRFDFVLDVA
jgi:protocatechuate 3,4-dioxygenase beta subunit